MMISNIKKLEHEIFVSGYNGSSPVDIILAVSTIIPGAALATTFTYNFGIILSFMVEYILCSLPLLLSFTFLNDYNLEMNAMMMLILFIRIVYVSNTNIGSSSNIQVKKEQCSFLTSCRASVNLATIIAILAVDFHIFPRRFAKTEKSGYSLMDMGAACYVYMNAITDNKYKSVRRNILLDSFCLSLLGVIRLLAVSSTHYQHHVTEYGLHANFFFTLAFIKISCFWIPLIPLPLKVVLGVLLSLYHQINLNSGLGLWTLSEEPRDNFFAANREWFISMPGFISIYLFGSACGEYIFFRKPSAYRLGKLALVPFCSLFVVEVFFLIYPSRRLANLPFILWITAFFNFSLTFYKVIEDQLLKKPMTCLLFDAINTFPLSFFLLGNIFTGLINIFCNTLEQSNICSFLIINVYLLTLLSVVTGLYSKKVKLKINSFIYLNLF